MCARRNGGMKRDAQSFNQPGEIMTAKPTPFTLHVPDADIADLRDRLARSRFPDQAPGDAWAYGTDVSYLRELTDYWRDDFDWRAAEAALNAFRNFAYRSTASICIICTCRVSVPIRCRCCCCTAGRARCSSSWSSSRV